MNWNKTTLSVAIPLLVLLFSACNRKAVNVVRNPPAPPPPVVEEKVPEEIVVEVPPPDTLLEIPAIEKLFTVVEIKKEACFMGGCPAYEFSLRSDGLATYNCKSDCRQYGKYHASLPREKVVEIRKHIHRQKMVELYGFYPPSKRPVQGIPLTSFLLAPDAERSRAIKNYHHSPKVLLEFEDWMERLIGETKWERSL